MTDILRTIGRMLPVDMEGHKDCIHVPVMAVIAKETLSPSDPVDFEGRYTEGNDSIGIVDPYLNHDVSEGETFWIFLYPGTIESLTHVWTHKQLDNKSNPNRNNQLLMKELAKTRLELLASQINLSYDELIEGIQRCLDGKSPYITVRTQFHGSELPDTFYADIELCEGIKITKQVGDELFTCAC